MAAHPRSVSEAKASAYFIGHLLSISGPGKQRGKQIALILRTLARLKVAKYFFL
jgi:hypothetical protein